MIALILGGAPSVWDDLAAAEALLAGRRHLVVAANMAGIAYAGHLDAWATQHPDHLGGWRLLREGNDDFRAFVAEPHGGSGRTHVVADRWGGSSGLYALQIALYELNATAAVLCGLPMEVEAGHIVHPGPWALSESDRQAFRQALPVIGARTRSMGGWTAELLGQPTPEWLSAIPFMKSIGAPSAQPEKPHMYKVENVGTTSHRFNARQPDGNIRTVSLPPGECGVFDVDPASAQMNREGLKVTPEGEAAPPVEAPSRRTFPAPSNPDA